MEISVKVNEERGGVELTFDGKPCKEVRKALLDENFRWHPQKKLWYIKQTYLERDIGDIVEELYQIGEDATG